MDIQTIEKDVAAIITNVHTFLAPVEALLPILGMFPALAPEVAVLESAIKIIKSLNSAAPDFAKNVQAVIADVEAVIAAVRPAATTPAA